MQQSVISGYERGDREPALLVLFAYARLANVYVDVLLDDAVNLPDKLPSRNAVDAHAHLLDTLIFGDPSERAAASEVGRG